MADRKQRQETPKPPADAIDKTGGETKASPKPDTTDQTTVADTPGGMTTQGGESGGAATTPRQDRQGGMIGEG